MAKQQVMKGVLPPLTVVQEAALLYIEAKEETARLKERENDRKKEMLQSARKVGVDFVKVRGANDVLHVFEFSNDIKIKHSQAVDIKIEKADPETEN